jgi:Mn2+/Fe2+ NRAMP family transporter
MGQVMPRPLVLGLLSLLFIANTINVGADLAAMGEAARLVTGLNQHAFTIFFAAASLGLQLFIPYRKYARFLMVLTFSLFAYVVLMFLLPLDWKEIGAGLIGLHPNLTESAATTIVAIFGTTISPYLFFWQAAQEVEDTKAEPLDRPLCDDPAEGPGALARIKLDTMVGMGFSNLVALAIVVTAAATLHQAGISQIDSAAQAAQALQPLAGHLAVVLFSVGIIGTGLLSIPVLAGSAAYALGEARGWPVGLARKPLQAKAFYGAIAVATLLGAAANVFQLNPVKALVWAAVLNGIVAVPVMALLMLLTTSAVIMGQFKISRVWMVTGWVGTGVMGVASGAFIVATVWGGQ